MKFLSKDKDQHSDDCFKDSTKVNNNNIFYNDQDFSMSSLDNQYGLDQHKKQGMTFVNEENEKVRHMRKSSVGQSILNFDSMLNQDKISNTPQSMRDQNGDAHKKKNIHNIRTKINQDYSSIQKDGATKLQNKQQNSQLDLNPQSKKDLTVGYNGEELNNYDRNILAPVDSQQMIMSKRKSFDTQRSKQINGVGLDNVESVVKINSRYDNDSQKRFEQGLLRSINPNDTNPALDHHKERPRDGTLVQSGHRAQPSFKFFMMIKPKIKKFFQTKTVIGRTRVLNDTIRKYIGDLSDFGFAIKQKNSLNKFLTLMLLWLERLFVFLRFNRLPLFDPESKIKIILNSLIVTYNCFYIFIISIVLIFDAELGHIEHHLTYVAMAAWITEMLVEMNTACYHNNQFITDRKIIIQIYAKEYFFFEILPLIFEGKSSDNTLYNVLLHLPLLLKLKGMSIILSKLEFYILQILERHYIFQLCKLIMQMLLYGHLVACCWYLIVKIEDSFMKSTTWLDASEIDHNEWWEKYIIAQYWAFSVMMNVTTKPTTPLELAYTSFVMLISCIAFGYLLSTIAEVIADLNKQQEEYKRDLNTLNSYMKRKKVDLSVKRRVNINLKTYYQQKSKDNLQVEKEALNKLSSEMLQELNQQANQRIIKQFQFFSKIFSEQTISKMYTVMEEEVYAPQQIVFTKNLQTVDQHYLYLIIKGEVVISIENFIAPNELEDQSQIFYEEDEDEDEDPEDYFNLEQNQKLQPCIVRKNKTIEDKGGLKKKMVHLKQGHIFGAYSFFTGNDRYIDIQCKEYTNLIKISRENFINILKENKKDYERFCEIRDKMTFSRQVDEIPDQYCFICNQKDHLFDKCCFGHFNKENLFIFYKYNYSSIQERTAISNRKGQKINTLKFVVDINKGVTDFRLQKGMQYYTSEDEEEQESLARSQSVYSQKSDSNTKMKKSKNISRFHQDDENSKLVYSQYHTQSPSQSKLYPSSDVEIIVPDQEGGRKTISQKQTLDIDDQSLINEESQIPLRSPNIQKRQSIVRATKPRRSFVKFDNQSTNAATGGANQNNNIVQIPSSISANNTNSINTAARGNAGGQVPISDQSSNNIGNRRKLSYLNLASPMMGAEYDNLTAQELMQKRKSFNQQSNYQTFGTNQSIGNNQNQIINNGNNSNLNNNLNQNINPNNFYSPFNNPPYSNFHQNRNQNTMNINQIQQEVDQCAQTQFTKLSNNNNNNQNNPKSMNNLNFRKTLTMLPHQMLDDQQFIWGFDKQKDYQSYFPYYNLNNVVKRVNNYWAKTIKLRKLKLSGKKITEISLKKKKQQIPASSVNINGKQPSMQSISRKKSYNVDIQKQKNDGFNLNLVQIDVNNRSERAGSNVNITMKDDKILKDFFILQGGN
ncbi:hypothetical protein ABPG74_020401 [Tetrahymena malaccensis]